MASKQRLQCTKRDAGFEIGALLWRIHDAAGKWRVNKRRTNAVDPDPMLPWSDLFIARGRALAAVVEGRGDDLVRRDLASTAAALRAAGMLTYLPPIEAALAG